MPFYFTPIIFYHFLSTVPKDKHDCFIQTLDGKVLHKAFSFANNYEGFEELYAKILSCNDFGINIFACVLLMKFGVVLIDPADNVAVA